MTGFIVLSTDYDTNGGITIGGNYTGGGIFDDNLFGVGGTNNEDIVLQLKLDNGNWVNLGNPSFTYGPDASDKTFSLTLTSTDVTRLTNGTGVDNLGNATFRFYDLETSSDGDAEAPGPVDVDGNGMVDDDAKTITHPISTPTIIGFSVSQAFSELNPDDGNGITLRGDFFGGSTNANNIRVQVRDAGTGAWTTLTGNLVVDPASHTYQFATSSGALNQFDLGDQVEFRFYDASSGGSIIIYTTPPMTLCFYPGTMIATPTGEVAVECLAIGDRVMLHAAGAAPIRWIGRNTVMPMFSGSTRTLPIRIRKNALADNVPSRDLLVSPRHALFVDGILAEAGALVNGTSIVRETDVPSRFCYYHVELAEHALILAENAPAESFIDNVDRANYDNWAEHEALYGDLADLVEMDLPRAKSQRQISSTIRCRLADRAAALGYSVADAAVA